MKRRALWIIVTVISALSLQGCAVPGRLKAVPAEATADAEIPGMPGMRYVLPEEMQMMLRDGQESLTAELKTRADAGATGPLPSVSFLAVSGGGANGAYSVGLLCGWTAAGDRPEFKLVTGISTGALIAPFAFLGAKYDDLLREFYTSVSTKDVLEKRTRLSALFNDGLADNMPLKRLIRSIISADLLREIANEHAKGRILLVATTNIDAHRPVIWNMTKIAASGHPDSLELFQEVLVASAAIPGAFPPTMFDVEADGQLYQEMHVDGGAFAQVFVYPTRYELKRMGIEAGVERKRTLYIIRNSKMMPDGSEVARRTLPIAKRAIASLIHTQGIGDLHRIYAVSERDGVDYNVAYIPDTFHAPNREEFDTEYMRALFKVGYEQALKGYPWRKHPPGM